MSDRAVYHVTPYANGWTLNLAGQIEDKGSLGSWDHKDMAIARAKELAQEAALGQVVVHGEDGRIQDEFTYGADPRNIPG